MTPNEIATLLAKPLGKEFDVPFREMIKKRIKYWRSTLIKRAVDKEPARRKFFLQTITVPMIPVNAVDCGLPLDCMIAETTIVVPSPITANKILFDYVGSATGQNAFTWVERSWLRFKRHDKYASQLGTYTWLNRKIQAHHNHMLPAVLIEGIFDDPEEVLKAQCAADASTCTYDDTEFHAPGDIMQQIIQSIQTIDLGIPQAKDPDPEIPVTVDGK